MSVLDNLAVIIPVGPKDNAWQKLLPDLSSLPKQTEIVLVGTDGEPRELANVVQLSGLQCDIKWVSSPKGRARQLNAGAKATTKKILWFVHADSRIGADAIDALAESICNSDRAIHYFDLLFLDDGPTLTRINTIGAWIRSHWMKLPFGDQAFCLTRSLFERLGGFDEQAAYGEDHLLVWAAHISGVSIRCTGASVRTSARRYGEMGWRRATASNMILTARQALPELAKLLRKRVTHAKS